jgi:hypothetical protein
VSLQDVIRADITAVFLNTQGFAEAHDIDGTEIVCVFDQDKSARSQTDGVYRRRRLLFVKGSDLGYRPVPEQKMSIDGGTWYVVDCTGEELLEVTLEANQS